MEKEGKIATRGQKGGQRQKAKSPQAPHSQWGMLTPGNVKVMTPLSLLFPSSFSKRPTCDERCRQTAKQGKKRVWTKNSWYQRSAHGVVAYTHNVNPKETRNTQPGTKPSGYKKQCLIFQPKYFLFVAPRPPYACTSPYARVVCRCLSLVFANRSREPASWNESCSPKAIRKPTELMAVSWVFRCQENLIISQALSFLSLTALGSTKCQTGNWLLQIQTWNVEEGR